MSLQPTENSIVLLFKTNNEDISKTKTIEDLKKMCCYIYIVVKSI